MTLGLIQTIVLFADLRGTLFRLKYINGRILFEIRKVTESNEIEYDAFLF